MANWVGKSVWIAAPLVEAISDHVMAATALHGDDTPVPVLAPGSGKTKTGRHLPPQSPLDAYSAGDFGQSVLNPARPSCVSASCPASAPIGAS
jgi:hypothetical protein